MKGDISDYEENSPVDKPDESGFNQTWDVKSKKFLGFSVIIALGTTAVFFLYFKRDFTIKPEAMLFKFLEFLTYTFAIYVGGNGIQKITSIFKGRK